MRARTSALEEANARLERERADLARMEIELRLAQKLEAVGQLAAGIAHEINTPIQFVGDNLDFLGQAFETLGTLRAAYRELCANVPEQAEAAARIEAAADTDWLDHEVPRALGQGKEGVERVARIVKAMKAFAHPDSEEQQASDLNQAILSTLTVARNELK